MGLTKEDSKVLKGLAIIGMVMLHLFCRKDNLPYRPLIWLGNTPLVYFLGLFGDLCVAVFALVSGYAHFLKAENFAIGGERRSYSYRWHWALQMMIRLWIIACIFSIIGLLFNNPQIPGSIGEFLLNCLTIKNSYNGAWWYANIYLVLIAIMPFSVYVAKKCPVVLLMLASAFYILGYGIRFWNLWSSKTIVGSWLINHIGLLGTTYLPYVIGMLFQRNHIIEKVRKNTSRIRKKLLFIGCYVVLLLMMVAHGIIQSLFVAVGTATMTVCIMAIVPRTKFCRKVLIFLGSHSANIWLVHMFFYEKLFHNLVFAAKYPVFIFLYMMTLSILSSYLVNGVSKVLGNIIHFLRPEKQV